MDDLGRDAERMVAGFAAALDERELAEGISAAFRGAMGPVGRASGLAASLRAVQARHGDWYRRTHQAERRIAAGDRLGDRLDWLNRW